MDRILSWQNQVVERARESDAAQEGQAERKDD